MYLRFNGFFDNEDDRYLAEQISVDDLYFSCDDMDILAQKPTMDELDPLDLVVEVEITGTYKVSVIKKLTII